MHPKTVMLKQIYSASTLPTKLTYILDNCFGDITGKYIRTGIVENNVWRQSSNILDTIVHKSFTMNIILNVYSLPGCDFGPIVVSSLEHLNAIYRSRQWIYVAHMTYCCHAMEMLSVSSVHLCVESPVTGGIYLQSNADIWRFLCSQPEQPLNKQLNCRLFETPQRPYDVTVMVITIALLTIPHTTCDLVQLFSRHDTTLSSPLCNLPQSITLELQFLKCSKRFIHCYSRWHKESFYRWSLLHETPPSTHHWAWWHHQMVTLSVLLALCAGNSPVTGEFP